MHRSVPYLDAEKPGPLMQITIEIRSTFLIQTFSLKNHKKFLRRTTLLRGDSHWRRFWTGFWYGLSRSWIRQTKNGSNPASKWRHVPIKLHDSRQCSKHYPMVPYRTFTVHAFLSLNIIWLRQKLWIYHVLWSRYSTGNIRVCSSVAILYCTVKYTVPKFRKKTKFDHAKISNSCGTLKLLRIQIGILTISNIRKKFNIS